jgi:hypothetical protein
MTTTVMPVLDWTDGAWDEYRYAGMDLKNNELVTYQTGEHQGSIIIWDDWSGSLRELLERVIQRSGFPIAVCKNEFPRNNPNEFFIINNESDAIMAVLMFQ